MNYEFLEDEITGYIDSNTYDAILLGTNPNSSHTTQFAENPRAALELVEKPFIVDMFPNLISPLFHTNILAFKNADDDGRRRRQFHKYLNTSVGSMAASPRSAAAFWAA
jgi:hypothetical protein